jgi:conjugal transfer pilus assembly protein TraV
MSLTGISGSESQSCPLSEGVTCKPMSQVYEESVLRGATPQKTVAAAAVAGAAEAPSRAEVSRRARAVDPETGAVPLRSRPNVMRLWIAPWEDADGDLHEDAWIAVRLDDGAWNIDHVKQRVRRAYGAAITPPPVAASEKPADAKPASPVPAGVTDLLPKSLLPAPARAPFVPTN